MATRSSELAPLPELPHPQDLPGAVLELSPHQAAIADHVLAATTAAPGEAHPTWLLILAMRGMGVTVDELCELAGKRPDDVLLFGSCRLVQDGPVLVGHRFAVTAALTDARRKTSSGGGVLDLVDVRCAIADATDGQDVGSVTNTFIFRRSQ